MRGGNEKSRGEGGPATSSKDLASINQLRAAVRQLQKDGQEQLTLEYESQATFEYFHGQINALQKGYKTLSDVLLEEVDTLRTEFGKRVSHRTASWCKEIFNPFRVVAWCLSSLHFPDAYVLLNNIRLK